MGEHRDHDDFADEQMETRVRDLPWPGPPEALRARVLAHARGFGSARPGLPGRFWFALAALLALALLDASAVTRQNATLRVVPITLPLVVVVQQEAEGTEHDDQQASLAGGARPGAPRPSGYLQLRNAMLESLGSG